MPPAPTRRLHLLAPQPSLATMLCFLPHGLSSQKGNSSFTLRADDEQLLWAPVLQKHLIWITLSTLR